MPHSTAVPLETIAHTRVPIARFASRTSRGVVGRFANRPCDRCRWAPAMVPDTTHAAVRTACKATRCVAVRWLSPPPHPRPLRPPKGRRGVRLVEGAYRKLPHVPNEATKGRLSLAGRGRRAARGEGRSCRRATSSCRLARPARPPTGDPPGRPYIACRRPTGSCVPRPSPSGVREGALHTGDAHAAGRSHHGIRCNTACCRGGSRTAPTTRVRIRCIARLVRAACCHVR